MKLHFGQYLMTEQDELLGHRVGTILTQVQDLVDNGTHMGARLVLKRAETAVNLIRKVLHQPWPPEHEKHLKTLQRVGVAIMRGIDEKDDLVAILATAGDELGKLSHKLGTPLHHFGSPHSHSPVSSTPAPPAASQEPVAVPATPGEAPTANAL